MYNIQQNKKKLKKKKYSESNTLTRKQLEPVEDLLNWD